ncbi:hypothetical protein KTGMC3_P2254 [Methanocalculus sp. MC3]
MPFIYLCKRDCMQRTHVIDEFSGFQNDIPGIEAILWEERHLKGKPVAEDEPSAGETLAGGIC